MSDKKTDWIHIQYEDIEQSESPKKRGVSVRFMVSPLDVPDMWRHSIQPQYGGGQELVVEFRYLAADKSLRSLEKDGVRMEVGKNSKRVHRLSIPVPPVAQDGDEIEFKIEMAIQDWERKGALRQSHASVIQSMLGMLKQQDLQPAL